jgi:hypothetical protein
VSNAIKIVKSTNAIAIRIATDCDIFTLSDRFFLTLLTSANHGIGFPSSSSFHRGIAIAKSGKADADVALAIAEIMPNTISTSTSTVSRK